MKVIAESWLFFVLVFVCTVLSFFLLRCAVDSRSYAHLTSDVVRLQKPLIATLCDTMSEMLRIKVST